MPRPGPKRLHQLHIRCHLDELERWQAAANARGLSLSALIRYLIEKATGGEDD